MISTVTVQNFKRFKAPTAFSLKPDGVTFLAGGNNSGKSTLLQALAVWEFARAVIEVGRGSAAFVAGWSGQRVGIGAAEFSPIALPDLRHLWTDLHVRGPAGDLRIKCDWHTADDPPRARFLEFGFALANDRLFLKPTASNLVADDRVPRLAYLPPFAGIGPREERMLPAARKRLIGRGLAGAVLRNLLYDFWENNAKRRREAKGAKRSIPKAELAAIRREDSWELLLQTLEEVFKTGLTMAEFNQLYHDMIEVGIWDGELVNKKFRKKANAPVKDLMVEGSGFLQWLSVYALSLSKDLDVLLLDEPDAHLHPALQGHLIQKLGQLARETRKQVLLATHSTTILSEARLDRVFRVEDRAYLSDEGGRVKLFLGLGSAYAPRLDQLKRHKRLFLHDGPSDLDLLKIWAAKLGKGWPEPLVCWKYTKDRTAREILFDELRAEIPGLKAISLQDRDDYPFAETKSDLTFDSLPLFRKNLGLRRWRRRNIENYLLCPAAIARASGRTEQEVRGLLENPHGLAIPTGFVVSDCAQTIANTDGKDIITRHAQSISASLGIDHIKIAEAMEAAEIPDDVKALLDQLMELCKP
jgi:energy-coupling factor transporter ATP-binding protein EcfA2